MALELYYNQCVTCYLLCPLSNVNIRGLLSTTSKKNKHLVDCSQVKAYVICVEG